MLLFIYKFQFYCVGPWFVITLLNFDETEISAYILISMYLHCKGGLLAPSDVLSGAWLSVNFLCIYIFMWSIAQFFWCILRSAMQILGTKVLWHKTLEGKC